MTSVKTCRKCGSTKAMPEFYKHSGMADGFLNICKECTKARVTNHRLNNLEKIRAYDRLRSKEKERAAYSYISNNRWRKRDKRISSAHNKVSRAIKLGILLRQPCSICNNEKSYAHHESYNNPLDVVWYCQVHHKERHKIMAMNGIDPLMLIDEESET